MKFQYIITMKPYDADIKDYSGCKNTKQMLAMDLENALDDPESFLRYIDKIDIKAID